MKKALQIIMFLPLLIWHISTRRAYYITGTFLDENGVRMFYKTTFVTRAGLMPISSLEKQTAQHFGVKKCIILFFQRIPFSMIKYVDADYPISIDFTGKD